MIAIAKVRFEKVFFRKRKPEPTPEEKTGEIALFLLTGPDPGSRFFTVLSHSEKSSLTASEINPAESGIEN